ncbi:MAG: N-6 DNA methylase, partial [Treponema sp.]|nr:N-6 DNA methylase [Treponema sp.]
ETAIKRCFIGLVNDYAEDKNLKLVEELEYRTPQGTTVYPDATLKDRFRLSYGYYEAKDPKDNLDKEIEDKIRKHYPLINTIFENSISAVLFQNHLEVMRIDMSCDLQLEQLLKSFIDFERQEIYQFHAAIKQFKTDLPNLVLWCKDEIDAAKSISSFTAKTNIFLEQCQKEINPDFLFEDIREILIQHMITDKLFTAVLREADFFKENNIARSIDEIVRTFFTREKRKQFEDKNKHFYNTIAITASQIIDYHEKQDFLKTLYEEFYKSYNPKAADRMGVIYTPTPIVNFMVRVTDELLAKHFNTGLAEKNVKIIDPATGTGTFITEIIEYIPPLKLKEKYLHEIFANEVAILPYYVSNLNIEYIYWQKMNEYIEYPNICYIDTLDNAYYKVDPYGNVELIDVVSVENAKRIKNQNDTEISVVIGNPPYNANQKNYNNQNANRTYPKIDKRIRETFTAESNAQKKKYEDMYFRFYRWAMDRIDNENGGIIAFVSNRSFIDAINTDGFRSVISREFDYLYIIDTQSDVRKNPRISGTKHNIFGIQTGAAIMFAVKSPKDKQIKPVIHYYAMQDAQPRDEKLYFLKHSKLNTIQWERIYPDKKNNWVNITDTDYESLMPLAAKNTAENAVFHDCSPGISSNRNDWVFDFSRQNLIKKVKYFIKSYNKSIISKKRDASIKWSRDLVNKYNRSLKEKYADEKIVHSLFRPFIKKYCYSSAVLVDRFNIKHLDCLSIENNIYIAFSGKGHNHGFSLLASKYIPNLDCIEKGQCIPMYILNKSKKKTPNVTDWALKTFIDYYKDSTITKRDIFFYVYAVLHDPGYALKYKEDLRRNTPRVPFYKNFHNYAAWGKSLITLHMNFEKAKEHPVHITKIKSSVPHKQFKYDKTAGQIIIDDINITGIPSDVLNYRLGQRSALEWIIDQYKTKKIDDPVVSEKFNIYDYSQYKDAIVSLIKKIITVSLESNKIIELINAEKN